jgi:hypothetical protein
MMRVDLRWDQVFATQSLMNSNTGTWTVYDALSTWATANGYRIVFILDWLQIPTGYNGIQDPVTQAGFALFCSSAMSRYAGLHYIWEFMNEPNNIGILYPNGSPDYTATTYIQLAQLALPAMKTADPNALIVLGNMGVNYHSNSGVAGWPNTVTQSFSDQIFRSGIHQYCDAYATHPYQSQDPISYLDGGNTSTSVVQFYKTAPDVTISERTIHTYSNLAPGNTNVVGYVEGEQGNYSSGLVNDTTTTNPSQQARNALRQVIANHKRGSKYINLFNYRELQLFTSVNVTNASGNGTTVTYTLTNGNALTYAKVGMPFAVTGVNPSAYNITGTIASISGNQFTGTNAATGSYVSGGSAVLKDNYPHDYYGLVRSQDGTLKRGSASLGFTDYWSGMTGALSGYTYVRQIPSDGQVQIHLYTNGTTYKIVYWARKGVYPSFAPYPGGATITPDYEQRYATIPSGNVSQLSGFAPV